MLDLKNRTPFAVALVPFLDHHGVDAAVVVVKATLSARRGDLVVAGEQQPIARSDTYFGEPGLSSVRWEADTAPGKAGTDVLLLGHAFGGPRVTEIDVELHAGPVRKRVHVTGERVLYRSGTGWRISDAAPFERLPLVWERAFGGEDRSAADPTHHEWEPQNPVGVGFVATHSRKDLEGQRLPNLENPAALVKSYKDRPPPCGLGFVARSWMPRRRWAGTYDDRWKRERAPLLPDDFDPRFFQAAPADQTTARPLRGGERIVASGVLPGGAAFDVTLPARKLGVTATIKGRSIECPPTLDTVAVEPDEHRVTLCWRAVVPCGRELLYVDRVEITDASA